MNTTNIIVKVENVDDDSKADDNGDGDKRNDDIDELVVPLPPGDSSSNHENNDKDDDDEPAATSSHELSVSPDQLPREQDDTPADQSSTLNDTLVPQQTPEQSSSDVISQELPPASADDTNDITNLLTSI